MSKHLDRARHYHERIRWILLREWDPIGDARTRWDHHVWPTIKSEMKKALEIRSRIQRAGWFN